LAKAIVIAAPHSGSGKTLVTLGLLAAFRKAGYAVSAAKVGPDYIDPGFHMAASGKTCMNLDLWAMGQQLCSELLRDQAFKNDLVIVEGVMGLFDGPKGATGSTADLAIALDLPVVLVIDAGHQAQSIAAIVHGFRTFRPQLNLTGVILTRVKSDRHEEMLRQAINECQLPIIACLRQSPDLHLPSRHLGLVQAQENQGLETIIESAAATVARDDALDKVWQLAAPINDAPTRRFLTPLGQHIAVARDDAFSFCYPHLIKLWRNAGATISTFSPLADQAPDPNATAVFLPGGYPELHAGKIASAVKFKNAMTNFKATVYGECGGYMVLGDAMIDAQGVTHKMLELLPVTTSFASRKLHLGYRKLTPRGGPWLGPLRGHEFHYSTIVAEGPAEPLFEGQDAAGQPLGPMGLRKGNILGSYAHVIAEQTA
jgi:cobyrinic acid a,c-diamide synthase